MLDDGQPQAGTAVFAGAALIDPVKRSKTRFLASSGMPMPVSDTQITAWPSRAAAFTSTRPPGSLYLRPFSIRLSSSSFKRPCGTATEAALPDTFSVTPAFCAAGARSAAVSRATLRTSECSSHWAMATDSSSESLRMSLIRSISRSTSTPIMVIKRF